MEDVGEGKAHEAIRLSAEEVPGYRHVPLDESVPKHKLSLCSGRCKYLKALR